MTAKRNPRHEPEVAKKASGPIGRPRTRPHPLDPGVMEEICTRLICGDSMKSIGQDKAMPDVRDIYKCMAGDATFATAIARAREAQQDAECERMVEMADAATVEDWQVVKFRVWARQWRAAKLAPKKYGEKSSVDVNVDVNVEERRRRHIEIINGWEAEAQERRALEEGE